jgi:uncharacterized cupredoxin-like copper-binding protein
MRPRLSLVVTAALAAAAMAALAAGCGGGSDDSGTTAASATTTTAGGGGGSNVDISATDFKLNPSDPKVKAGQVAFNVSNDGQTVHSLEVEGPNGEEELPSDLSPGQSGVLSVDLSKPGRYEFYCPVGNHEELGMKGEITVQ